MLSRSLRALAWLGDAEFEREVRWLLVQTGDHPPKTLDRIKAKLVNAQAQAHLLESVKPRLTEREKQLLRRATNLGVRGTGRGNADTRTYRQATALEALVAYWTYETHEGPNRLEMLLRPSLRQTINQLLNEVLDNN